MLAAFCHLNKQIRCGIRPNQQHALSIGPWAACSVRQTVEHPHPAEQNKQHQSVNKGERNTGQGQPGPHHTGKKQQSAAE